MDNLDDSTKRETNSTGESRQPPSGWIVQATDGSSRPHEVMQHTETLHHIKQPIPEANATSTHNQFMGTRVPRQAASLVTECLVSLWRFKWTVLLVFVLVSAPMIVFVWTQVAPRYQARGEVRIRPIIPHLVFRTDDNGAIPFYNSFVNTQISIMKSPIILRRILEDRNIQETQWYKKPPKSTREKVLRHTYSKMERLRDSLSVQFRRGTEIVDVRFIAGSAKDAQIFVDTFLDQYIQYTKETSDATKDNLYRQLVEQYRSLENEILGREKVASELRRSLKTANPQELISAQRIRLDEMQARLSELRQRITLLEGERPNTDGSSKVAVDTADRIERQPKYYMDAQWRAQDIKVKTIRHQIATAVYSPGHPNMARAEKDLQFEEELLRLREAQLDEQWRDRQINAPEVPVTITGVGGPDYKLEIGLSTEQQLVQAKLERELLLADFEKQQAEFESLFESAQLIEKENNELLHKRELFGVVRQRLDQKAMERNVPGSIEVLLRASTDSGPSADRRVMYTAMAIVMGLGMGGCATFLKGYRDRVIYTHEDMPYPMQVPFLGYLPSIRTRRSLDYEVTPPQIESIRFVRTALLSRLDGCSSTTVLVTSSNSGTGKSTFTRMLGESLAKVGKKVLMIDVDFQKMTLTKQFNLSDKGGFIESLCCKSVKKEYIFPAETSGLSIIPAGKRGNESTVFEEIANGVFETCIGGLRKCYDIILLDSPPILVCADTTIISSQVDGTIMVERERVSRREHVIDSLACLGSAGGRLLGTVFIGSTRSNHKKYGYRYHYSRTN